MTGQSQGAATPASLVVVVTSPEPAACEQRVLQRLQGSGVCRVVVRDVDAMGDPASSDAAYALARVLPAKAAVTAIVDLSGRLDTDWNRFAAEGVWQLRDVRGLPLGAPHHGLATLANAEGIRLHLVAWTSTLATLVDTASGFAEPREPVSPERLARLASALVVGALCEIRALGSLAARPPWQVAPHPPTAWERLAWRLRALAVHAGLQLKGFLLVEQWMVGVVDMPFCDAVRARRLPVHWLGERETSRCWADPFGNPGRPDEIYCEEVDLRSGLGRIVSMKLDELDQPTGTEPVDLGLTGHQSFPYLFRHDGALYCVAESSESRRCVLNRQDADGQWQQVCVLLEDMPVVDPTVFVHEGRFWLAYTDVSMGQFDNLCLCHADNLLGPWRPHPQNPVKFDHWSARAAGSVVRDGDRLLRVAQVCRSGYGQAVAVNRIVACTPEYYREEVIGVVSPAGDRVNPDGLHTMSAWGDRVLVDGKRHVLNADVLWHRVKARLARAMGGRLVKLRRRSA